MSNHDNARRGEEKRTEHGSRWENRENDRNSSRARAKWKARKHRSFRRNGKVTPKFLDVAKAGTHALSRAPDGGGEE